MDGATGANQYQENKVVLVVNVMEGKSLGYLAWTELIWPDCSGG